MIRAEPDGKTSEILKRQREMETLTHGRMYVFKLAVESNRFTQQLFKPAAHGAPAIMCVCAPSRFVTSQL